MLPNTHADPVDILDYTPLDRGLPRWVFFDLDKMDIPDETLTISIFSDGGTSSRPPDDSQITQFSQYVRVLGEEYIEYIRHAAWPKNLFMRLSTVDYDVVDDEIDVDGWICDRIEVYSLHEFGPSDEQVESVANPAVLWDVNNHSAERYFQVDQTYQSGNPMPGGRLMEIIAHGAEAELPKWVFFPSTPPHLSGLDMALVKMLHFSSDGNHGFGYSLNHPGPVPAESQRVSYFRRSWWPVGAYRLAEVYYTDSVGSNDLVQIPIFDDEPSAENAHRMITGMLEHPTGQEYSQRLDLNVALSNGSALQLTSSWISWAPPDEHAEELSVSGRATQCAHLKPTPETYGATTLRVSEEMEYCDDSGVLSLYRFERWPINVWSHLWKINDDGEREVQYGPSAFGRVCGREDSTTLDNPIHLEAEFDFQKWVRPEWDSRHISAYTEAYINVGIVNSRWSATARRQRDPYHISGWNDRGRGNGAEATYYRRPSFPVGLWRRVDSFTDHVHPGRRGSASMSVERHEDEPGQPDCEGPWYNSRLRDWVQRVSEQLGRPIFSDPSQGMPWLKFWTPEQSDGITSSITPRVGGHHIYMPVGELPRIRGQSRGTNVQGDLGDFYYARRYRSGVALAFNPCALQWTTREAEEGTERPEHPIDHVLAQFEEWFLNYHDPDVVEDMVDDVFEKFRMKTRGFQERINNEQRTIRRMHDQIAGVATRIAGLYEQKSYYDTMTKGRFRKTLEANRSLISNLGTLTLDGEALVLVMNQFEIEGQMIGPLVITMTISGTTYPVRVTTQANASQYGNAHPHVDVDGRVCWGSRGGSEIASQMSVGADPLEFMFWAAEMLRINYRADDAYCKIHNWDRKEVWWCDHCEVEHPNGTHCPNQCAACSQYVDMDDHATCAHDDNHGCWNTLEHSDCPVCAEQRNAAQAELEAADAASAAE